MINNSNPYLRLPPDIFYVKKAKQVAIYSKSGAILLDGPDASVVVEKLFPFLNGTRTEDELFKAIPDIQPADLAIF